MITEREHKDKTLHVLVNKGCNIMYLYERGNPHFMSKFTVFHRFYRLAFVFVANLLLFLYIFLFVCFLLK